VGEQRVVEQDGDAVLVADGRHAADAPAGRLLHLVGLRHPRVAGVLVHSDLPEVHAVRAARHDDHGVVVGHHDDAGGDLRDVAADGVGGVGGGLGPLVELVDVHVEVVLLAGPLGELLGSLVHARRSHGPARKACRSP